MRRKVGEDRIALAKLRAHESEGPREKESGDCGKGYHAKAVEDYVEK